jgi:hypothetical protein
LGARLLDRGVDRQPSTDLGQLGGRQTAGLEIDQRRVGEDGQRSLLGHDERRHRRSDGQRCRFAREHHQRLDPHVGQLGHQGESALDLLCLESRLCHGVAAGFAVHPELVLVHLHLAREVLDLDDPDTVGPENDDVALDEVGAPDGYLQVRVQLEVVRKVLREERQHRLLALVHRAFVPRRQMHDGHQAWAPKHDATRAPDDVW